MCYLNKIELYDNWEDKPFLKGTPQKVQNFKMSLSGSTYIFLGNGTVDYPYVGCYTWILWNNVLGNHSRKPYIHCIDDDKELILIHN